MNTAFPWLAAISRSGLENNPSKTLLPDIVNSPSLIIGAVFS
ncbi:hypothetical protein AB54_2103 [Escherichia coli 2-011-08_S1_C3]|nr:hypothetical protein AB54_2103 [Escherichia coli 2-011-08_S1_C3]